MSIEVQGISKAFGKNSILRDVTLEIPKGELVALLGPSGSGKTTLLRLIAGLEAADQGRIVIDGKDATHTSVQERQVGFVFQHYALFRHMTVFDNIAFGLQVRPRKQRLGKAEIARKVNDLLALVQLEGFGNRYPAQLSGGQRQRVALARALAIDPKILLLDEPFGALDAKVRQELRRWLRQLHQTLEITSVFVTHDQEEALEVADRIVIMNEGRIEQIGTPHDIYHYPANPFVYGFLGRANRFEGPFDGIGQLPAHSPFVGYVRPHELEVTRHRVEKNALQATIQHVYAIGPIVRLDLKRAEANEFFEVEMTYERYQELNLQPHETVYVRPRTVKVFTGEKGLVSAR
ncbi:sulfate ABC transporter ATP-binding protein [Brevibacillus sp. SYP-B805]|uniref:sulfate/molybdate ABC transporter ATP-binding protein n=1 Tax=Brevibacillus sp. SYP-B805 TaxID=1578199 RepID=UPI0013EDCC9D|nr:sulfate ABC transporter ATP-binding protein [Brevibacillus sp. SYP-B805]NGQ96754.1 sulfate ABC transporter ATP-binding protein [Brevibacillus sp. SYP-B805]